MKKTIYILLGIGILSACSSKTGETDAKTGESSVETWKIVKAEGTLAEANVGTQYIFDGKNLTLSGGGMKNEGTFEMKSDTLVFHMKTFTGDMLYVKSTMGKQMILKPVGSDQTFYLDKK